MLFSRGAVEIEIVVGYRGIGPEVIAAEIRSECVLTPALHGQTHHHRLIEPRRYLVRQFVERHKRTHPAERFPVAGHTVQKLFLLHQPRGARGAVAHAQIAHHMFRELNTVIVIPITIPIILILWREFSEESVYTSADRLGCAEVEQAVIIPGRQPHGSLAHNLPGHILHYVDIAREQCRGVTVDIQHAGSHLILRTAFFYLRENMPVEKFELNWLQHMECLHPDFVQRNSYRLGRRRLRQRLTDHLIECAHVGDALGDGLRGIIIEAQPAYQLQPPVAKDKTDHALGAESGGGAGHCQI